MVKSEIRKIYATKRMALGREEYHAGNTAILGLFNKWNWSGISTLMSYYPITGRQEFNAAVCELSILSQYSSVIIAHPRITEDGVNMDAVMIDKDTEFSLNRYNISEPVNGTILDPAGIDIIFVPLIAFDTSGYRVGYGRGFYDRFLAKCRPGVLKVGFSFFGPLPPVSDIDQFDVPLTLCFTPTRVYEF